MNSSGSLARLRIVLSHTGQPRNIGSAARAMKTMGLARLALVRPQRFPDREADALASGADDVLAAASVHATLDEALAGTTLAFALTARRRDLSHPASDARAAAAIALEHLGDPARAVAFVFGNEMSGLANDEVLRCQRLVHIPANPAYSSLNLAQAVQIVAYELWTAASAPADFRNDRQVDAGKWQPALASHEAVEAFYAHFERAIVASGFLDPQNPRRLMQRMRRLFGRAGLEREEIDILRGVLAAFEQPQPRRDQGQ
jgi:tRNA/rRNA methyltransferase